MGVSAEGAFIVKSFEAIQSGRCQARERRSRPCAEQSGPQDLPIGERPRLSDDNSPDLFLPPAGGYPPVELIRRHELESQGDAQHAVVMVKYVVEAQAWKVHVLSVSERGSFCYQ
jgi:hypothetical protein